MTPIKWREDCGTLAIKCDELVEIANDLNHICQNSKKEIATLKVQNILSSTVSPYLFLSVRHLISTLFIQANQTLPHVRFKTLREHLHFHKLWPMPQLARESRVTRSLHYWICAGKRMVGMHVPVVTVLPTSRHSAFTPAEENYCLFAHKNLVFETVTRPQRHRGACASLMSYTIKRV